MRIQQKVLSSFMLMVSLILCIGFISISYNYKVLEGLQYHVSEQKGETEPAAMLATQLQRVKSNTREMFLETMLEEVIDKQETDFLRRTIRNGLEEMKRAINTLEENTRHELLLLAGEEEKLANLLELKQEIELFSGLTEQLLHHFTLRRSTVAREVWQHVVEPMARDMEERVFDLTARAMEEAHQEAEKIVKNITKTNQFNIAAIITGVLAAGIMSFFLSRRLTNPIIFFTRGIKEILEDNEKHRIECSTKDEIEELANSFNQLIDQQQSATWRLEHLLQNSSAVIYSCAVTENCPATFISPNVVRQTGHGVQDFLDDPDFWFDHIHPDDQQQVVEELADILAGKKDSQEYRFRYADGSYVWMYDEIVLVRDDQGELVELVGCWIDINERKKAEAELQESHIQLIQSGKMAAIGELASGIAHELNQPLMVIRTRNQLMQRCQRKGSLTGDQIAEALEAVDRNTKRMMKIINHLSAFSRQSDKERKAVAINKVIEDCFYLIGEQLRLRDIRIEKEFAHSLPRIEADDNQLEQVFLNLLGNARDAIVEKRENCEDPTGFQAKIKIQTSTTEAREKVIILISDNGCGIHQDKKESIFDPFVTTKEVGKGTGLGLSISHGIIQKHNGLIRVAKTGPEGTSFMIELPISQKKSSEG